MRCVSRGRILGENCNNRREIVILLNGKMCIWIGFEPHTSIDGFDIAYDIKHILISVVNRLHPYTIHSHLYFGRHSTEGIFAIAFAVCNSNIQYSFRIVEIPISF